MANEYLKRTPTSTGNRKVCTFSVWTKLSKLTTPGRTIFSSGYYTSSTDKNQIDIVWASNDRFQFEQYGNVSGAGVTNYYSRDLDKKQRDASSWAHILISFDSTLSIAQDRAKVYVNGIREDKSTTSNQFPINYELPIGVLTDGLGIKIGNGVGASQYGTYYFQGELFDYFFIDGQALTPEVFGYYKDGEGYISAGTSQATDFRNGKWTPKKPQLIIDEINESGGFGVNGFYLPMNSSNNFGADFHTKPNTILKLKDNLPQPKAEIDGSGDYSGDVREELGGLPFAGVVKFDGSGDYLTVSSSQDTVLGNTWTVETWIYFNAIGGGSNRNSIIQSGSNVNTSGCLGIYFEPTYINVRANGIGTDVNAPIEKLIPKKWHHIAVSCSNNFARIFIDGQLSGSGNTNGSITQSITRIGSLSSFADYDLDGYISNLRVLKGTALYTENFTPPKYKLEKIPNTVLLCCNSKTDATNEETGKTITKNGDVYATTSEVTDALVLALPFVSGGLQNGFGDYSAAIRGYGSAKSVTIATLNSTTPVISGDRSNYYDSSIEYINNGNNTNGHVYVNNTDGYINNFNLTTESFTAEAWFYPDSNSIASSPVLFSFGSTSDYNQIQLMLNIGGIIKHIWSSSGSGWNYNQQTASQVVFADQWTHICFEKNNNIFTTYVNGVAVLTTIVNDTINYTPDRLVIGGHYRANIGSSPTGYYFSGYIQDVKLYKGIAKYTGGFDVPKPYTPVGIATWRAVPDTTANNFATWNPLFNGISNLSFSDGNLTLTESSSSTSQVTGTIEVSSGKWYYESYVGANPFNGSVLLGIGPATRPLTNVQNRTVYRSNGDVYTDSGTTAQSGTTYTTGNIIGIAFDVDAKKLWFSKNGSWVYSGEPSTGGNTAVTLTLDAYSPFTAFDGGAGTAIIKSNFGQNPTFSGKIANIIRVNSSDSSWDQTPNTGSHNDWTISNEGRDLNVSVSAGFYARAYLYLDPNEKYLLSFDYISGPANLGILSDTSGYLRATDGSLSPNGLSAGNSYTFEISNSNWVNFTGFNGQTYDINNIYLTRVVPGYQDSNGKGEFRYQPPAGFLALCEDNLPRPTIDDPGKHFKTVLWTGDGNTSRSITGLGFQPDFVWIKPRNYADQHVLCDSIRGPLKSLYIQTNSEANNGVLSFNDDGFSLNSWNNVNDPGDQYVAWCWKAGGSAVTNTDGTITSQVSANQTAGFSIVGWTGNGVNATIGHGLGKTPKLIIVKNRDSVTEWPVLETMVNGGTYYLRLDQNYASTITSIVWNNTNPTSDVFSVGTYSYANENNSDHIAYCWAEIEGFSKFGSYVGNDSTDGPFVYCGFKPALVILKASSTTGNWCMIDNARNSTNPTNLFAVANTANVGDDTGGLIDFVSNGFKLRLQSPNFNGNGVTYIFAAFAESPFQNANAK